MVKRSASRPARRRAVTKGAHASQSSSSRSDVGNVDELDNTERGVQRGAATRAAAMSRATSSNSSSSSSSSDTDSSGDVSVAEAVTATSTEQSATSRERGARARTVLSSAAQTAASPSRRRPAASMRAAVSAGGVLAACDASGNDARASRVPHTRAVLLTVLALLLLCTLCSRDALVRWSSAAASLYSPLPSSSSSLFASSRRHPCAALLSLASSSTSARRGGGSDGDKHASLVATARADDGAATTTTAATSTSSDVDGLPLLRSLRRALLARPAGLSGVHVRDTRALLRSVDALHRAGVTIVFVDDATSTVEEMQRQLQRAFAPSSRRRQRRTTRREARLSGDAAVADAAGGQCIVYIASLTAVQRVGNALKELLEDNTLRGRAALPPRARGVLVLASDTSREQLKQQLPHRVVFMFRSVD